MTKSMQMACDGYGKGYYIEMRNGKSMRVNIENEDDLFLLISNNNGHKTFIAKSEILKMNVINRHPDSEPYKEGDQPNKDNPKGYNGYDFD